MTPKVSRHTSIHSRLLPWVHDGEALVRIRVKDTRLGEPVGGEPLHSLPCEAVLLAAPPQRAQPDARHIIVECSQCRAVGRHGMVGEEASDHLLEPGPLLGDRFVHAPSQFLLDPPERCPHAIAPCCSFDEELTTTVAFTDEGKAKKVEGLRFSEPAMGASFRRKAAKLDQAGLVRIERQRELLEPLAHIVPEAPGVRLVLEADDNSSRPGELHPQALTDPDVSVFTHPALIVQPSPRATRTSGQRGSDRARKSCGSSPPPAADVA